MDIGTLVGKLTFVGPVYSRRLQRLGVKTLQDLLYHFPNRYEDFSLVSKISRVQAGETVTIQGEILSNKNEYTKNRKVIQKALVEDDSGKIEAVWFNQRYLPRTIPAGTTVSLSGKIEQFGNKLIIQSPEYERFEVRGLRLETIHTGRLVPVYPETSSLSSKWLRGKIAQFLPQVKMTEFLPSEILKDFNLIEINTALNNIHFPSSLEIAHSARQRFAFEELFLLQLGVLERKNEWQSQKIRWKLFLPREDLTKFIASLPFELTLAQKRAIEELLSDLTKPLPMNRLLEGDVGSGKTVVAAVGVFIVAKNNLQTVVMAPTQILAVQHYQTLSALLEPHGIKVFLVTGKMVRGNEARYVKRPTSNDTGIVTDKHLTTPSVVVGTHALLHRKSLFNKLALVVIDEQHKFGVEQRAALLGQTGAKFMPHVLTMTATPIPRTVTLTLYGDLDLSILDELPPGRQKITTWLVPPQKRARAYNWIGEQIKNGSQGFIVCPLIEESAVESMRAVRAATAEFKKLSREIFPQFKLGLLHGRLKAKEKEEVIEKFRKKTIDILVSTPVVEVGIDIPNATVMMVEAAERFGLAQLHQLRGRVGRGEKKSYCLLFTESPSTKVISRLQALEETKNGAELAELDLRLRGPGEIFGTAQHGFPELKVASFSDFQLIKRARQAAEKIFPRLSQFPKLSSCLKTQLVVPN